MTAATITSATAASVKNSAAAINDADTGSEYVTGTRHIDCGWIRAPLISNPCGPILVTWPLRLASTRGGMISIRDAAIAPLANRWSLICTQSSVFIPERLLYSRDFPMRTVWPKTCISPAFASRLPTGPTAACNTAILRAASSRLLQMRAPQLPVQPRVHLA